jgi:hypothetical protein
MSQEKQDAPVHELNEKGEQKDNFSKNDAEGLSGSTGSTSTKESDIKSHMAVSSAEEIPNLEKIGWKRVGTKTNKYDDVLKELYYNDLWLYSGVVFVSLFTTWFIVLCGGSLGWIFVLCAFIGMSYYNYCYYSYFVSYYLKITYVINYYFFFFKINS